MDVAGEGREPSMAHILKVATSVGLSPGFAKDALEKVASIISCWPDYASALGVSAKEIHRIGKLHNLPRYSKT